MTASEMLRNCSLIAWLTAIKKMISMYHPLHTGNTIYSILKIYVYIYMINIPHLITVLIRHNISQF